MRNDPIIDKTCWKTIRRHAVAVLTCSTMMILGLLAAAEAAVPSALPNGVEDHFFLSDDGVRLHYLEAGSAAAHTIVFVPGWTMPAWIWMPQILAFSHHYHVVAFDPRGQGDSAVPAGGYNPERRGRDIANLLARLPSKRLVVIAWSLGVLDTLAFVHHEGDQGLAGLVLVDNSVGEEPPPVAVTVAHRHGPPPSHEEAMHRFVRSMFRHAPSGGFLERLTQASLRMPEAASRSLLAYPLPRSYWREALHSTKVPTLYAIRPHWEAQGQNLVRSRPNTEMVVFAEAGHALFLDEPGRFNTIVEQFLRRRIWP